MKQDQTMKKLGVLAYFGLALQEAGRPCVAEEEPEG